ncbi:MAG: hypothetical protein RH862_09885 [Leptospiraceae bacterium]
MSRSDSLGLPAVFFFHSVFNPAISDPDLQKDPDEFMRKAEIANRYLLLRHNEPY